MITPSELTSALGAGKARAKAASKAKAMARQLQNIAKPKKEELSPQSQHKDGMRKASRAMQYGELRIVSTTRATQKIDGRSMLDDLADIKKAGARLTPDVKKNIIQKYGLDKDVQDTIQQCKDKYSKDIIITVFNYVNMYLLYFFILSIIL